MSSRASRSPARPSSHSASPGRSGRAAAATEATALRKLLGRSGAGTLAKRPEALGPVQAAGEEELLVGAVQAAGGNAFWIWATIDNLTVGGAGNVLRLAETVLRPGTAS